ncbi:MAG: hypothetical protein OEU90_01870 [Gammaproteobacteria bacterium]|jgi:tetratricopeptide (TPR) repeat protein|nr:hypothetical protein [Gammaproteobacteria bacterium]MDH3749159.1 hypothetical protein [Gammaproteobacteria bacterium]MDH3804197.1 hypothetical protein [Gammaproteobacteria bacterium]
MSILFWGLTVTMLLAAIGFAALPLRSGNPLFSKAGFLAALVVALTSFGLYAFLGSPDAVNAALPESHTAQQASAATANARPAGSLGTVASLVGRLKDRLQKEPDDAGSWLLLARSYQHIGRPEEALAAYVHAKSLGESDTEFEASLLGANQAPQMTPLDSGPAIRGRVVLSPDVAAQVSPDDTVFIFAKKSAEDRMPVVALRKSAADLPIDFFLTDNEIMVPDTHLADFDELLVTARISRSGNAADNSGGLEAWSKPVSPVNGGTIELIIAVTSQSGGDDDE